MPPRALPRRYRARHAARTALATRLLPAGVLASAAGVAFVGLSSSPAVSAVSAASPTAASLPAVPVATALADEQAERRASAQRAQVAAATERVVTAARADAAKKAADRAAEASRAAQDRAGDRSRGDREPGRASRSGRRAGAVRPVEDGPLTSPYGHRWGRLHAGLDFGVPVGTPVVAVADGVVTKALYDEGGYGYYVTVEHANGTSSLYAHLSRITVERGRVQAGDVLGRSGNTGHSTGPHLHFEMRTGSGPFDARPWLRERGVRV